nr:immunoglobulin light chain junction region [Macaca mulatta]MOV85970.1 immunoglobulin light chain junction region [Macaca mulatta]MOW40646.1 immunoglobulin light chain junction region [Macaca mulatta]MOW40772.1 immunoglobulin light chain junction region [Macaca mulatta]MOW40886.1 immunoglobulin light chain junction region [Macaca mulatta]
CQQAYSHPFTF